MYRFRSAGKHFRQYSGSWLSLSVADQIIILGLSVKSFLSLENSFFEISKFLQACRMILIWNFLKNQCRTIIDGKEGNKSELVILCCQLRFEEHV